MAAVREKHFSGGIGINVPDKDDEDLASMLRAAVDDITDLRTKYTALLADFTALRTKYNAVLTKLDADAGVTDTNYNATQAAAALTATAVATQSLTKA